MSIENSYSIINHCRLYTNQHLSDLQLKLSDNAQTCEIDHLNLITEYIYHQWTPLPHGENSSHHE